MFQESFWCADPLVLIPEIKCSCYPEVYLNYVCGGAWFWLNFHVVLKTSFIGTRALFRVLCSGVSVFLLGLCIKLSETVLQLVVLVVNIIVGPGCVRLVQSIILIIKFLRAWSFLSISISCLKLVHATDTVCCIGHYSCH